MFCTPVLTYACSFWVDNFYKGGRSCPPYTFFSKKRAIVSLILGVACTYKLSESSNRFWLKKIPGKYQLESTLKLRWGNTDFVRVRSRPRGYLRHKIWERVARCTLHVAVHGLPRPARRKHRGCRLLSTHNHKYRSPLSLCVHFPFQGSQARRLTTLRSQA